MSKAKVNSIENVAGTKSVTVERLVGGQPGVIFDFAGTTAPDGALPFGDTEYAQADYPELYAAIGDAWATTGGRAAPAVGFFRVPPQEVGGLGLFLRGTGATNGPVGTYEADQFKEHKHIDGARIAATTRAWNGTTTVPAGDAQTGTTTDYNIAGYTSSEGNVTETRPQSITVLKCIWTGR